jgi:hypothetical protein
MKVTPSITTEPKDFGLAEVKEEGKTYGPVPDSNNQSPTEEQKRRRAQYNRQHDIMSECLEERERQESIGLDEAHDDTVPVYAWSKYINYQLNQAAGGRGPFRMRYLKIMALALAAIETIDRADPPAFRG